MRWTCVIALLAVLTGAAATVAEAGGYTDASYITPFGRVGQPYVHQVEWKPGNGCPPYGYAVVGGELPPGLSLSSSGSITGIPTRAGTYSFYIRQTDQCGPQGEGNAPFRITILGDTPTAEVRTPFSIALATLLDTGGLRYAYVPVAGFPYGIGLDPIAGTIFGSPRHTGVVDLTLLVIDTNDVGKPLKLSLVVLPRLAIVSARLQDGSVGVAYRGAVRVSGGKSPVWRIPSGHLPPGLTLSSRTGAISGVPRRAGLSRFTVAVRDALGAAVAMPYTLKITP
jgi:large repetitive protein